MTITRLYNNNLVKIHPDSFGAAVILAGITRVGLKLNNQVVQIPTSGEAYARFQALYGQKVMPTFETLQVAYALDQAALTGLKISALATGTGLTLFAQQISEGGVRTAGANHDSWNFKEGMLYPSGLECEHQGDCTLSYDMCTTYDTQNNPVVIAATQNLPTPDSDASRHTLGKVTLGDIVFNQKLGISLNFGINAKSEGADSDIWDTFCWIEDIQPTITIRGVDKKWFDAANIPLTGLPLTHANTSIYFRKRAAGGTFVADGTAVHIKVTICGLATIETAWDASGSGKGTVTIKIDPKYDGTNLPLVINTASAIT